MGNVYLVTSGSYSDYGVRAVFSAKEKATAFIGLNVDEYNIEEMVLDDYEPTRRGLLGEIDLESGEVNLSEGEVRQDGSYQHREHIGFLPDSLNMWFDLKDRDRAPKVLSEKRAQALALYPDISGCHWLNRETLEVIK